MTILSTGVATEFINFTRASNATVTDSNGLIDWAAHNLLLASEQFDASNWTKTTTTVAANSFAAPNSTTTAETLTAAGANSTVLQSYTALAVPYTFGVWLRRKTGIGNIQIAADSGTYTTVTITSEWALYTVSQTPAAGTISAGIRIVTSADEVYAWGAHLYRSDLGGMQPNTSAYPMYNPTTPKNLLGSTEDFSAAAWAVVTGTATKTSNTDTAPNGLQTADTLTATSADTIVWQTYNPVTNCQYTASIWLRRKTGSGTVQFTADGGTFTTITLTTSWQRFSTTYTAPTGLKAVGVKIVTSGDEVYAWGAQLSDSASLDSYVPVYGAAVTSAAYYGPRRDFDPVTLACKGLLVEEQRANLLLNSATLSTQNVTVTAVAHTLSFYGTGTVTLTGVSTAGPLVGTGAYPNRVTLTFTPTAGTLTLTVTGSVTQAQLEAGAFATSYIPTTTASATRNADLASVHTQAFSYSATEGTVVVNVSTFDTSSNLPTHINLSDGTTSNYVRMNSQPTTYKLRNYTRAGGADVVNATTGGATVANEAFKAGVYYKANSFNSSVNGSISTEVTTGAVPAAATTLSIGNWFTSAGTFLNGHIRQITYLPRRISNTELQTRTA